MSARGDAERLFELAPVPMYVFERDSLRILEANEAARRQYGWSREEIFELTLKDLRARREWPAMLRAVRRWRPGAIGRQKVTHRRSDGSEFAVHVQARLIRWRGASAFLSVARDVTRARRGADRLEEAARRYRLLFDSVRDYAVFLLDASGRVVSWNEGARRMTGWTAGEMMGSDLSRFYTPAELRSGLLRRRISETVRRGSWHGSDVRLGKGGRRVPADYSATAVRDRRGRLMGIACVVRRPKRGELASSELARAVRRSASRPVPGPAEESLTPREREVLELVAGGLINKEIAHRLGISVRTVETHREHVMRKLGARTAADLVRFALSRGLLGAARLQS